MHYYKFSIGDYRRDTFHLSPIEHYVYRSLLDWMYLEEAPIPLDMAKILRYLRLDNDRLTTVEQVLNDFFTKTEEGYVQERAMAEISEYQRLKEVASKAGKASAEARKNKASKRSFNGRSTTVQPTINHKPLTNNNKKHSEFDFSTWPSMPSEQVMSDWFDMRKRLKAPVSQTVINNFGAELRRAQDAGYSVDYCMSEAITRNWRGLKVEWLNNANNQRASAGRPESKSERSARIAREILAAASPGDLGESEEPWPGPRDGGHPNGQGVDARILPFDRRAAGDWSA